MSGFPIFRPVAEHSLLVEFGDAITPEAHAGVLHLDAMLTALPFEGFREATPAYVNIMVSFDPLVAEHAGVETYLRRLIGLPAVAATAKVLREVLVCYDADLCPDMAEVAKRCGMDVEAVIAAHLAGEYSVFLYGFAPGYAYLGGVPAGLQLPRKDTAVRDVPGGTVIIAGAQCIVTTLTMPTGWWRIGRSPTQILRDDPARPFLFDVGDTVRFRRVDRAGYEAAL